MKQTYSGGCHCGAVRYEADLDLSHGTLRCNCSMCGKTRAWLVAAEAGDFRLLRGADALSDYQFGTRRIHHLFCRNCGVKSFSRGNGSDGKEHFAVAVSCLDDVADAELAALPVIYVDGRNNDFRSQPAETRYM
jgi:hypothetical protein